MSVLVDVSRYIRDVLGYDEQLIVRGRLNVEREDFTLGYIVVDNLGAALRIDQGARFDDVAERVTYSTRWQGPVTIDFYGTGAQDRAELFAGLHRTQAALELRRALKLGINQPSSIVDLKALTGQQYGERVQVTVTVTYSTSVTVDALRIDTAQIEIQTEKGIE